MPLTITEIVKIVEKDHDNLRGMVNSLIPYLDHDKMTNSDRVILRDNLTSEEEDEIRVAYNKYRAAPYDWYYREDSDVLP